MLPPFVLGLASLGAPNFPAPPVPAAGALYLVGNDDGEGANAVSIARSTDGGATWNRSAVLAAPPGCTWGTGEVASCCSPLSLRFLWRSPGVCGLADSQGGDVLRDMRSGRQQQQRARCPTFLARPACAILATSHPPP